MAYTKVSNKSQDKDVNYLNKDYNSFKNQLLEFAQIYYPNTFNDFSEASPGMMFIEMAAYVGDVLSFYTDTQLQETFLNLAQEKSNLYNLAYAMGYTPKMTTAASVNLDIFQLVPSIGDDYRPDYSYCLQIGENSKFRSTNGPTFSIQDKVDFRVSGSMDPTNVSIYNYDTDNNPQYYLLKKTTQTISAEKRTKTFDVGSPEQFLTLGLFDTNILSIESIIDADGNEAR